MENVLNKSFKCVICNTDFTRKGSLGSVKRHISSVHEEKPQFRCEICGKCLTQKSSLSQHISTNHEGKKLFKCNICECSFSKKKWYE